VAANLWFGARVEVRPSDALATPRGGQPADYDRDLAPWRSSMISRVPARGGVLAGFEFLSHLTHHPELHSMHHFLAGHYTFSSRRYEVPTGIEAVIADLGATPLIPYADSTTSRRWDRLIRANGLRAAAAAQDLVLFLREPADTVDLVRTGEFAPGLPRRIVYDGQLLFLGSDAPEGTARPGGLFTFRTYWRRPAPVDRMFLTEFVLVSQAGRAVCQVWRYLGYTISPPSDWPEGVMARETYRLVIPAGTPEGRYFLGMRVWQRGVGGQSVCEADDPGLAADDMFVTIARFPVRAAPSGRV